MKQNKANLFRCPRKIFWPKVNGEILFFLFIAALIYFQPMFHFCTPENIRKLLVFYVKPYRSEALAENGLTVDISSLRKMEHVIK